MIERKDEYLTGTEEIDNHHHKLFDAVNRAYELSGKVKDQFIFKID